MILFPEDRLAALLVIEMAIIIPSRVSTVLNANVMMYFELLITGKFRFSRLLINSSNYPYAITMWIISTDLKDEVTLAVNLKYYAFGISA